jgi:hypothetical protein
MKQRKRYRNILQKFSYGKLGCEKEDDLNSESFTAQNILPVIKEISPFIKILSLHNLSETMMSFERDDGKHFYFEPADDSYERLGLKRGDLALIDMTVRKRKAEKGCCYRSINKIYLTQPGEKRPFGSHYVGAVTDVLNFSDEIRNIKAERIYYLSACIRSVYDYFFAYDKD